MSIIRNTHIAGIATSCGKPFAIILKFICTSSYENSQIFFTCHVRVLARQIGPNDFHMMNLIAGYNRGK